jgi:hypothetical protein
MREPCPACAGTSLATNSVAVQESMKVFLSRAQRSRRSGW